MRRLLAIGLALAALLAIPSVSQAYVYWANYDGGTIGRANNDGSGANQNFITGASKPCGLAVDGQHIYWANNVSTGSIGRANLDGSGVKQDFIPNRAGACGPAVNATDIYWAQNDGATGVNRASLDGSGTPETVIPDMNANCSVSIDSTYIYWDRSNGTVGRSTLAHPFDDQNTAFVTQDDNVSPCGLAVNAQHLFLARYYEFFAPPDTAKRGTSIRRVSVGDGGTSIGGSYDFAAADTPCGVALDSSYLYWGNYGDDGTHTVGDGTTIGRASLDRSSPANQAFITGAKGPCGVAADSLGPKPQPQGTSPTASLGSLSLSHSTFRAAGKGASIARRKKAPVGTTVKYRDSQPATTRFTVQKRTRGARKGKRCVKRTTKNRRAKACVRYVTLRGSFSHADKAGVNRFKFSGRLRGHKLKAGRYRLVARPTFQGRTGKARTKRFRIVR